MVVLSGHYRASRGQKGNNINVGNALGQSRQGVGQQQGGPDQCILEHVVVETRVTLGHSQWGPA